MYANAAEKQKSGHRLGVVCVLAKGAGAWKHQQLFLVQQFASHKQREGQLHFMAVPFVCRAFENKDWLICSGLTCSYLQDPEQLLSHVFSPSLLGWFVVGCFFFFQMAMTQPFPAAV